MTDAEKDELYTKLAMQVVLGEIDTDEATREYDDEVENEQPKTDNRYLDGFPF